MELKAFYKLQDGDKQQIICFPYLGGSSYSFQDLTNALPDDYEIWVANPPGHFGSELPLIHDIHELVEVYYEEISKIIHLDCVFFGHSMGAVVSYFLIRKMMERNNPVIPRYFFVSGSSAPVVHKTRKKINECTDQEVIDNVCEYDALPDSVLKEPELMKVLLPIFRADFGILETGALAEYEKIDVVSFIIWGECDKTEQYESALIWNDYFTSECEVKLIRGGGHMFIHENAEEVATYVIEKCSRQ